MQASIMYVRLALDRYSRRLRSERAHQSAKVTVPVWSLEDHIQNKVCR